MNEQNQPNALLGQILLLTVALVVLIREMSLPRTLFAAMTQILALPKILFMLIMRALLILASALSLITHTWQILKAILSVSVIAVIIVRLGNLFGKLRL